MLSPEEKQAVVDLFPFLGDNPVIIDAGSNKGSFSEIFIQEYKDKCHLHLFEPNKMLLDYTRIKFEYEKNITYNELGISHSKGDRPFFYFENYNNEISSIYPDEVGGWEGLPIKNGVIKTTTIDEYCFKNSIKNIDFLKLDIEGSEVDAIIGCTRMLNEGNIKIIQIEYGGHYVRSNRKFQDVIDIVAPLGYKIYKYIESNFYEVKDFKEDYHPENYYITKEEIHNYSADGGWMNPFILSVVDLPKFDFMRELGAYEGITTKYMCQKMLNEGGRVVVVDPLMDVYIEGDTDHPYFKGQYHRFIRNTRGLPVELHRGKTEDELPKQHALRFQFTYIDSNHWPPWPYFDGVWSFATTVVGGWILFDDYAWNDQTKSSIDKFLDEFSGSYELVRKGYQVLIRKTRNQYNEITQSYY